MLGRYFKYLLQSKTRYKVHSPFVFQFINEVLRTQADINYLNQYCSRLRSNETLIDIQDFGAGSRKQKSNKRKVKEIYKNSSSSPKKADLIRRICEFVNNNFTILELGTNLGVATYAISQSPKCNKIISIEGCPNLYEFSSNILSGIPNVELINSDFDSALPSILSEHSLNAVYIDGNHTYQATLDYFKIIQETEVELVIFDDIHWSEGMLNAWKEICSHEQYHVSVELFNLGILWRRSEQRKEHFTLRY
ncbi:MAG: class I SAM-dependent methyltransferase [Crocinitomicaceae bacterium]|nr:class I SAM-dependent methyltransferase [Crocinitomicaceae bacterium]